jgi:hypothetical protein
MVRVKEHYHIEGETGWRPWYQLALALACNLDDALTTVDPAPPQKGKTAPKARSAEGLQLVKEIEALREDFEADGKAVSNLALLAQHQREIDRYRCMPLDKLERLYYRAKAFSDCTSKRRAK